MKAIFISVICVLLIFLIFLFFPFSSPGSIELELFDAVKRGDAVSVIRLVEGGADVTVPGKDGVNAVYLAARNGSYEILDILIDSVPPEKINEDIAGISILLDMKKSIIKNTGNIDNLTLTENQLPDMKREIDTKLLELDAQIVNTLEKMAKEQSILREYKDKENNATREVEELKAQLRSEIYKVVMSDIIEYGDSYFNEISNLDYDPENSGLLKLSEILEEN